MVDTAWDSLPPCFYHPGCFLGIYVIPSRIRCFNYEMNEMKNRIRPAYAKSKLELILLHVTCSHFLWLPLSSGPSWHQIMWDYNGKSNVLWDKNEQTCKSHCHVKLPKTVTNTSSCFSFDIGSLLALLVVAQTVDVHCGRDNARQEYLQVRRQLRRNCCGNWWWQMMTKLILIRVINSWRRGGNWQSFFKHMRENRKKAYHPTAQWVKKCVAMLLFKHDFKMGVQRSCSKRNKANKESKHPMLSHSVHGKLWRVKDDHSTTGKWLVFHSELWLTTKNGWWIETLITITI